MNKETTVRITSDIKKIKNKFGSLIIYQECFEIGIDMMYRILIAKEKKENEPKLLRQRNFYESHKPKK